jgi:ABC-type transport system involved in cytochrome c biogenesis ATPase subunit
MSSYTRTAIRRLSIRGFRSIRSLELIEIPDLVVLHGPNGAGKSNVLLATQVVRRALTRSGDLPIGKENAVTLSQTDANETLGLRPTDFHFGASPEIRIGFDVSLGTRAIELIKAPMDGPIQKLSVDIVVQLISDTEMLYWFDRAEIDDIVLRWTNSESQSVELLQQINQIRSKIETQRLIVDGQEAALAALDSRSNEPEVIAARTAARGRVKGQTVSLRNLESLLRQTEMQLDKPMLLVHRIRYTLIPKLIHISAAYRVPGDISDPETDLHRAALAESGPDAAAMKRLGERLGSVGFFGGDTKPIYIRPVSNSYGERVIHLSHPLLGMELPVRNLGSGEQQIVYMLAQRVITPCPIALLEEPEAHLHTSLMERFARVLRESVDGDGGTPDVDQLWVATHHHHFALALSYYDVKIENGATTIETMPRAKAAKHFYEPGPIWEALRQLANSAKMRESVVFRDADGNPVTAREILESIENDPLQHIAKEYVRAMTEAMVLAMRQRSEKAQ